MKKKKRNIYYSAVAIMTIMLVDRFSSHSYLSKYIKLYSVVPQVACLAYKNTATSPKKN